MAYRQVVQPSGVEQSEGFRLVRFAQSLSVASSRKQLERNFLSGFGRLLGVEMYGFDLADPLTGRMHCVGATANVSDLFAARYEREGRDLDPVTAEAFATERPAYNLAMMSLEEWLESPVYRRAYHLHGMRHVAEVPIMNGERLSGSLHLGNSELDRDFVPGQLDMAAEIADLLGFAFRALDNQERLERERDQAHAALALTGAPVVVSDPRADELRLNAAAQRLLADIVEADECLHALLARPADGDGRFARRVDVQLATGETGVLYGHATPATGAGGSLVVVLELERERPGIARHLLAPLTTREAEVAELVVDGLADREIAECLYLSRHTVSQYVKRIYRKLEVDSRVALTRLLLGPPAPARRD